MPRLRMRLPPTVVELDLPAGDLAREAADRYRPFRTSEPPELRIAVRWADAPLRPWRAGPPRVEHATDRGFRFAARFFEGRIDTGRGAGELAVRRTISQLDTSLRVVATSLGMSRGVLFLHAAAIHVGGAGILFPAPSGGGKTTLGRKCLRARTGDLVLTDEIAAVWAAPPVVAATPFWGTFAKPRTAARAPLRRIVFLRKGEPRLRVLTPHETAFRLIRLTVSWSDDRSWIQRALATASLLASRVPSCEVRYDARRTDWRAFRRRFLDE